MSRKSARRASFYARNKTSRWVRRTHLANKDTPGYIGCTAHGINVNGKRLGPGIFAFKD